jgi:hypothetical protein
VTKPISIPNTFASATSAIPLSQLDQDFSTLANATNDLATYSNYVADTGAADAFIVNYPANTNTSSLTTGLRLQFKAANANTGASTLNVQVNGGSIGTAAIRLTDGSALPANTIIAGALVDVMYDGTNFQIMNDPSGGQEIITNLTLSGNLTVAGTSTFTGNVTGNVVNTTTSTITNLTSSNVTITGGTISNVTLDNVTVDVETFSNITINGTASFAAGTVSAPAITTTGDTNTGIYFPAADTIAFTEGGVESMRIDSSGNVGIGTSSPTVPLTVGDSTATNVTNLNALFSTNTGTGANIVVRKSNDTAGVTANITFVRSRGTAASPTVVSSGDNISNLVFSAYDGTNYITAAQITSAVDTTPGTNDMPGRLVFSTTADGAATVTERMRIDSSGNVGVGTTAPACRGDFRGTSGLGIKFQETSSGNSNRIELGTGSGIGYINADAGAGSIVLGLNVAGTERMRITSGGNVGIGNSSPSNTLSIQAGTASVRLDSSTGTNAVYSQFVNTGGSFYVGRDNSTGAVFGAAYASVLFSEGAYPMNFYTAGTERMRISSGGRLLLGTTTTDFPVYFKLSSDSGNWFAKFENTQSSTPYGFYLQYPNAAPNGTASDFIYCADSAAARMTVRSNGGIANYSANDVNLSDEREKTNIELAGSYLDKICAIPVKTFNYIDQNREEDDGLTLGVIAQDVQKVAPELVMESNWAGKDQPEKMRLSIYQTDLQYALMKCIQEQQAMIEELKAEVALLKSK